MSRNWFVQENLHVVKLAILFVIALCVAVVAGGCTKEAESERPVATPALTLDRARAPLGSPIEATYRFTVAQDAPSFDQDYRVLVHFLDADDELMWTDDHYPPLPTSKWTPGQTVEYTRTVFVPIYPYIGQSSIRMGLYSPKSGNRLPLAGETKGQHAYNVGTLQLQPQSENVFLIFKDGWHPAEIAQDNASIEWQWTKKEATISFRNPRKDCLFYLQVDGRPDLFPEPPQVTVRVGTQEIERFVLATGEQLLKKIPIAADQLGTTDMVDLIIQVDKTFVPALTPAAQNRDTRELGIRVFHVFLEPKQ